MRAPTRVLLLVLVSVVALAILPSVARSEVPTFQTSPDASKTVLWVLNDSTSLTAQNVGFGGGNASLPWAYANVTWPNGTVIAAHGALDSHLVASSVGISLKQNWSNRLADGDFAAAAPWTYVNGSADNTTASWISGGADARLNHTSDTTQSLWDSLDTQGLWAPIPVCTGSSSQFFMVSGGRQKEGTAALGDYVNVSAGSQCYAGAVNSSAVAINWNSYDQLNIWVFLNRSVPAAFQVSAFNSATLYATTPIGLFPGWQDVAVDLTQLGSPRTSLTSVTLRIVGISGQAVSNAAVYFDDIRVGAAKAADTTAYLFQRFTKDQATTPLAGSAYLSFDWCLRNATGVASYSAYANLSGPSGFVNTTLASPPGLSWSHFSDDVSSHVVTTGVYNLSFALRVVLDNISASNVTLFIDNASFVFPGTQGGTYLSDLQMVGVDSAYTGLSWTETLPSAGASVLMSIRTGNSSTPGDPTWSSWQTWFSSPASPTVPGALYFQLRADLSTTNASVTPILQSLSVATRHFVDHGSVVSGVIEADAAILGWRSFNASYASPSGTSIAFELGNGSYFTSVTAGSSLVAFSGRYVQWRAILTTSDGLLTPRLHAVSVTYDFQGPPARVVLTASGRPVAAGTVLNVSSGNLLGLGAIVYDAGSHVLPANLAPLAWTIDNASGGSVASNGTYTAGKAGTYTISAVVVGTTVYASVQVRVTGSTDQSSQPPLSLWDAWPILAVLVAGLAGFLVYEVVVRRLFAIDDVFLIAKDGRLIFHNTRRMRADRDEDILSSMLTAIMAFLRDQDPEENGELKRFQVGGKTTLLERGEHAYLTAVYSGRVPGWAGKDLHRFMTDLESHFGEAFANWSGSPEDLHGLKEYMQRFVTRARYHGPPPFHAKAA